ncbi:MAG TPA: chemotaxis protein CheA [Gemmatimonadales bacterium]|nr:chemotaxis protein CheA [Gemmatimonadales bacterium]
MDLARYTALFLSDSRDHLQRCNELLLAWEQAPDGPAPVAELFRALHSIKGASATMGFESTVELAHAAEQVLAAIRDGALLPSREVLDGLFRAVDGLGDAVDAVARSEQPDPQRALVDRLRALAPEGSPRAGRVPAGERRLRPRAGTPSDLPAAPAGRSSRQVRVDLDRLNRLVNDVGELVVARNRLAAIADRQIGSELEQVSSRISGLVAGLQSGVLHARMAPVAEVFDRFPRMARDLGRTLGKEIRLELQGADIELDRSVLDGLADPLTHLVRNAADHGLEPAVERLAASKPREGLIRLRAERARGGVTIVVADDGRGIDRAAVRERAVEQGLLAPEAPIPDAVGLLRLLATPGLSTRTEVTGVSGRGVGVDAVMTRIRALSGRMELKTAPGRGTVILLHLPVTRAIVRALLVAVAGERYAIPFGALAEASVHDSAKGEVTLRGEPLPTADLRHVVGLDGGGVGRRPIVVVETGGQRAALVVDALLGQQDVVVEPMAAPAGLPLWVGGATILPDGVPALILDPAALF